MVVDVVMKLAQVIARPPALLVDDELASDARLESASWLATRFASLALRTSGSWLQALMMTPTSSSYFLHWPNASLQPFTALAIFLAWVERSHPLMMAALSASVELAQQSHAAAASISRHSSMTALKSVIAAVQIATSVALGWGRLEE